MIDVLRRRFEEHVERHPTIRWEDVWPRLEGDEDVRASLQWMEQTGGEPDVIGFDARVDAYLICDCSAESPAGRRNLCYDGDARARRKRNPPLSSAEEVARGAGVLLASETEYRMLQDVGEFDLRTSSWVATPPEIRRLGGALFCERRYDHIFVFHNGADSYYAARGFRAVLWV